MSKASELKAIGQTLASYSLMSVPQLAAFLGKSYPTAKGMVDDGTIPSVPVGRTRMVDPIDAIVHVLAGREGCTAPEFWAKHGEGVAELARGHYTMIRKIQAGVAA